ncbi:MAG: cysteine desulfurase family protein [Holosporales bacterium]
MSDLYLDYNASAPMLPEALQAVHHAAQLVGNPSSVHTFGRRARGVVDHARRQIAAAVDARPDEVIFVSSGTEANNLALHQAQARGVKVCLSAIEHDSVLHAVDGAVRIPVTSAGVVDLESLEQILWDHEGHGLLVSVMTANNETGIVQPIKEIAHLCQSYGAHFHTDAVQAFKRIPLSFAESGAQMMTLSSHKIGGPLGVAALILRQGAAFMPQLLGGGQEQSRRAGTLNTPAIAGFGEATAIPQDDRWRATEALRLWMEDEISRTCPDVMVIGRDAPRLPNTTSVTLPGMTSELAVMNFDLDGFAVSAGSACSSGKVKPSHVLTAMGLEERLVRSAIRISLTPTTTQEQLAGFVASFRKVYGRAQQQSAADNAA